MYRIKNEERWIQKSIESILDICSEIVILDDGSTDQTIEICSKFDKVEIHTKKYNSSFNEAQDRNLLLKLALKKKPNFILALDGDEMLMPLCKDMLFEEIFTLYPDSNVFSFQFLTLWDSTNQIRSDGIYSNNWQKRLFRVGNDYENLIIPNSNYPGNLHCGSIPNNIQGFENPIKSNVKIFHFGSFDAQLRMKKYVFYTKIDPNNPVVDNYTHMISDKGRLSGKNGFEFKAIPEKLTWKI